MLADRGRLGYGLKGAGVYTQRTHPIPGATQSRNGRRSKTRKARWISSGNNATDCRTTSHQEFMSTSRNSGGQETVRNTVLKTLVGETGPVSLVEYSNLPLGTFDGRMKPQTEKVKTHGVSFIVTK